MSVQDVGIRVNLLQRREAAVGLRDVRGRLDEVADAGHDVADAGQDAARGLEKASSRRIVSGFAAVGRGVRSTAGFLGRGFVGAAKGAVVGATAVGVALAGVSVGAIQLSSDARETASAFDTVFGPSAKGIQRDLDGLTARFGIYNPELQDAARQFGVFGKAAGVAGKQLPGFSTDLVKAGLDLSSFYNTDPGETFEALQSGLSGEAEPLRKFGIFISDASMKAKAATMGLTGELSEQQKVMVRQRLIMESLGDAQGDMARTSAGFANQQRGATGRIKTFLSMIGGPLTTAATGAFRGFNRIATVGIRQLRRNLPGLERGAQGLSKRFDRWGRQLAHELPGAIKRTTTGWGRLTARVRAFMKQGGREEVRTLGRNVKDLAPAAAALGDELPGVTDTLSVFNTLTGFLAEHTGTLTKAMPFLVGAFIAYKAAQLGANIAAAASPVFKVLDYLATKNLTKALKELAVAQGGAATTAGLQASATGAVATATSGATKAQKGLNLAMRANVIGMIVTGVMLLVGGFVLLYKKSDTFRGIVDKIWGGLKKFGAFIGKVFVGYLKLLAKVWLTMARVGITAFTFLVKAAFKAFEGILSAADKGLGWVPGLGDKIGDAKDAFGRFSDGTISKLKGVSDKLKDVQDKVDNLGKDRDATLRINVVTTGTVVAQGRAKQNEPLLGGGGGRTSGGPPLPTPKVAAIVPPPPPPADDFDNPGPGGGGTGGPFGRATEDADLQLVDGGGRVMAKVIRKEVKKKGNRQ